MKAIASFFVDAFMATIFGSPSNSDCKIFFSCSLPAIIISGKSLKPFGPIDHSSQNSSAVIMPSNGYAPIPSCEASQSETESIRSNHCSKSMESYAITFFQWLSAFFL